MNRALRAWPAGLALLFLIALLPIAGCDSEEGDGPSAEVKVMTYNLYLGGDLFPVTEATSNEEAIQRVTELWATVQASRFDLRAKAIADQIEIQQPDLIGLQEVSRYRTQTPSDFVQGTTAPNATTDAIDFLGLLTAELAARGLDYRVVLASENADVELPAALVPNPTLPGDFVDVRLTDRDVILARAGVETSNPRGMHFDPSVQAAVEVPPGSGNALEFTRGYQLTDATVDDVTFTFANSHLEVEVELPADAPGQPQEGQVLELIDALGSAPQPVVLVGDFNSPADGSGTRSYGFLGLTYADAAAQADATDDTCCQAANLRNPAPSLMSRIDLVLYRGDVEALSAEVVGDEPSNQVEAGDDRLWPSDHASVVATLRITN